MLACGGQPRPADSGAAEAEPAACEAAPTCADWTEGFVTGRCQACHAGSAPERHGAPEGVTFDGCAQIVAQAEAIGRTVLDSGTMPPGGGVTDDERALLEDWLACPR